MAGDQAQFYQLLNTLLATDNDIRSQAEVSIVLLINLVLKASSSVAHSS